MNTNDVLDELLVSLRADPGTSPSLDLDTLAAWLPDNCIKVFFDEAAASLAARYKQSAITFAEADDIVNHLWGLMLQGSDRFWSKDLDEVYDAFDAGEDTFRSASPASDFTDPAIRTFTNRVKSDRRRLSPAARSKLKPLAW